MIHDFKASRKEKERSLAPIEVFKFDRREIYEAFINQSTVKNRIRYSAKKFV